jgi:large subunit ribosomal protein L7/L12
MSKYDDIIKKVEGLSVLELSELVKELEEKFGVSAAPMMMAGGAAPAAEAVEAEAKSTFNVILKDGGSQKIQVIKVVRELTGKGLKEAKDMVDAAPQTVKENLPKAEAEEVKKQLESAGAIVELK